VVEDFRFSTSGGTKPDGIDMDKVLSDYIILEFKKQSGLDEKSNRQDKRGGRKGEDSTF
jgi:molecular chaperone DnaK (HSP70)